MDYDAVKAMRLNGGGSTSRIDEHKARQIVILRDLGVPHRAMAAVFGISLFTARQVGKKRSYWRVGEERRVMGEQSFRLAYIDPEICDPVILEGQDPKYRPDPEAPQKQAARYAGHHTTNGKRYLVHWHEPEGMFGPAWYWYDDECHIGPFRSSKEAWDDAEVNMRLAQI